MASRKYFEVAGTRVCVTSNDFGWQEPLRRALLREGDYGKAWFAHFQLDSWTERGTEFYRVQFTKDSPGGGYYYENAPYLVRVSRAEREAIDEWLDARREVG